MLSFSKTKVTAEVLLSEWFHALSFRRSDNAINLLSISYIQDCVVWGTTRIMFHDSTVSLTSQFHHYNCSYLRRIRSPLAALTDRPSETNHGVGGRGFRKFPFALALCTYAAYNMHHSYVIILCQLSHVQS